jgi:hypothetical protein
MESIDVQQCGQQCQHHEHRDRHIRDAHGRPGADPQGQDSKTQPTAYAAPRNAAVTGGWMVQAKCCSVLAERTNNTTKASAVSSEKAHNSHRVPGRSTSSPGGGAESADASLTGLGRLPRMLVTARAPRGGRSSVPKLLPRTLHWRHRRSPGNQPWWRCAKSSTASSIASSVEEYGVANTSMQQASALTSLNGKPLIVLIADEGNNDAQWQSKQDHMATLSTNSLHRHANATHASLLDDQADAAAASQAIHDVVIAVRTSRPLAPG